MNLEQAHINYADALACKWLKSKGIRADDYVYRTTISAARLGLVCAAHTFDDTRGVNFYTYAFPFIHGKIVDEVRFHYWSKRHNRVGVVDMHQDVEEPSYVDDPYYLLRIQEVWAADPETFETYWGTKDVKEAGERVGISKSWMGRKFRTYLEKVQSCF